MNAALRGWLALAALLLLRIAKHLLGLLAGELPRIPAPLASLLRDLREAGFSL